MSPADVASDASYPTTKTPADVTASGNVETHQNGKNREMSNPYAWRDGKTKRQSEPFYFHRTYTVSHTRSAPCSSDSEILSVHTASVFSRR